MIFIVTIIGVLIVAAIMESFNSNEAEHGEHSTILPTSFPQMGTPYFPQMPVLSPDKRYIWNGHRWIRHDNTGKGIVIGIVLGIILTYLLYNWLA